MPERATSIDPHCRRRQTSRSAATPGWPQSALAAQHPKNRRAALSHRPACAVQQQPGGTGRANDEIAPEDLRRLPLHGGCDGFCRDPLAAVDSEEAGVGYPANLERQPGQSNRKPQGCVIRPRPGLLRYFNVMHVIRAKPWADLVLAHIVPQSDVKKCRNSVLVVLIASVCCSC